MLRRKISNKKVVAPKFYAKFEHAKDRRPCDF